MHSRRILVTVVIVASILAGQAHAADRRVPAQYSTIAAALAAANAGDRVVVAPGTYDEHDLVLPSGVTLVGRPDAPQSVVIDAGGNGRALTAESLDLPASVIGLTLTGGHAQGTNSYATSGGGLLVSRAEVRLEDVRAVGNSADGNGGGVRVCHGKVVMVRCEVSGNTAGSGGGAVDVSYDASINGLDVDFADNTAAWGGALSVRASSHAAIFEGRLVRNRAVGSPGLGGALACDNDAEPSLTRCVLADNEARRGGAIYAAGGAEPYLSRVTVDRNTASGAGAALYCKGTSARFDRAIISFHPQTAVVCVDDAEPVLTASDMYGNVGGDWAGDLAYQRNVQGNFSADPLYCSPNDHQLQAASPCAPEHNTIGLVGALGVGCDITTDVPPALESVTLRAQPNPFNPLTEVVYALPAPGRVRVSVYDIRGRRLAVLVDEDRPAGEGRVRWEARDDTGRSLSSGTYLLVLETGGQRLTSKLMLVR